MAGSQDWALPDTASGARIALIETSALWAELAYADIRTVIDAAATAVAYDIGGDRVFALASLYEDTDSWEFARVLTGALEELGHPVPESSDLSISLRDVALSAMCRRFLTGAMTAPQLAHWAAYTFWYDAEGIAGELARMDDDYEIYGDADAAEEVTRAVREIAARQVTRSLA
ncbi:hypothetical protein ACEXQE_06755 [Herbiconiux sp. P17]|uniref:hypothetical protein n=1 Tax=Herbiconiux wuyangfengii TaxID=3342794 RepID=UPI0035B71EBE